MRSTVSLNGDELFLIGTICVFIDTLNIFRLKFFIGKHYDGTKMKVCLVYMIKKHVCVLVKNSFMYLNTIFLGFIGYSLNVEILYPVILH